jgi:hypothetical protein
LEFKAGAASTIALPVEKRGSSREDENDMEATRGVGFSRNLAVAVDSSDHCRQPAGKERHAAREGDRAVRWD